MHNNDNLCIPAGKSKQWIQLAIHIKIPSINPQNQNPLLYIGHHKPQRMSLGSVYLLKNIISNISRQSCLSQSSNQQYLRASGARFKTLWILIPIFYLLPLEYQVSTCSGIWTRNMHLNNESHVALLPPYQSLRRKPHLLSYQLHK